MMSTDFAKFKHSLLAGKYRLDEIIGRGGFSAVYRGEHVAMEREVAVKLLTTEGDSKESMVGRFSQEAKVISQLKSASTITVYDYGHEDECFYLVMEFVDGDSLRGLLKKEEKLDAERTALLGIQMLQSLEEAHHYGVLHRDLKPANIMVSQDYRGRLQIKVVDFGIAKVLKDAQEQTREEGEGFTEANTFVGTPQYAAPEQLFSQDLGVTTDIWGVGTILYECVTGERAAPHKQWYECAQWHLMQEQKKEPLEVPGDVAMPGGLREAINRALKRRAPERWQDTAEMRQVLEAALGGVSYGFSSDSGISVKAKDAFSSDAWDSVGLRSEEIIDPNLTRPDEVNTGVVNGETMYSREQLFAPMSDAPAPSDKRRRRSTGIPQGNAWNAASSGLTPSSSSSSLVDSISDIERSRVSRADAAPSNTSRLQQWEKREVDARQNISIKGLDDSSSIPVWVWIILGVLGVIGVGIGVGVAIGGSDEDREEDERENVQREEELDEDEAKKGLASPYSSNGILLAIKGEGWTKEREEEPIVMNDFRHQILIFRKGEARAEIGIIEVKSTEMALSLKAQTEAPAQIVSFDDKLVRLTPLNKEARGPIGALKVLLERYKKIIDDEERGAP